MNDRGGNGADCFDINEWGDITELTNVEVAGLGKCTYLVGKERCSSKMKPKLRAECVVLRGQFCILASCCLSPMKRNSVLDELRVSRLAVIQEEISCKAVWRLEMLE